MVVVFVAMFVVVFVVAFVVVFVSLFVFVFVASVCVLVLSAECGSEWATGMGSSRGWLEMKGRTRRMRNLKI